MGLANDQQLIVTRFQAISTFIGGLGLILAAVKLIRHPLLRLGGSNLSYIMTRGTSGRCSIALTGLATGALLQSTSGITMILVNLMAADAFGTQAATAILAWANVGTAGLIFVASIRLDTLAMIMIGISAFALCCCRERSRIGSNVMEIVVYLGIILLGVQTMRSSAGVLDSLHATTNLIALTRGQTLGLMLAGCLFGLLAQSSSTATVIAIAAVQSRLVDTADAALVVLGASLGSGLGVLLVGWRTHGAQKQLFLFQALLKASGVVLMLPLLLIARCLAGASSLPFDLLSTSPGYELAYVYLACQLSSLASYVVVRRATGHVDRWASRVMLRWGR
jgi:phosphate:Na+ symporter